MAILDDAVSSGKARTANAPMTDLRQMFRFALDREMIAKNPLNGVLKKNIGGKETERDRTLSDVEIRSLWKAAPKALHGRSAVAVWLILSTACRVGEAMSARWEDVNLEAHTWYLPNTKNSRDHLIHLSDFALSQFETLAAMRTS